MTEYRVVVMPDGTELEEAYGPPMSRVIERYDPPTNMSGHYCVRIVGAPSMAVTVEQLRTWLRIAERWQGAPQ